MLSFFLKILKQKCGSYVCVQLLQTLNILFENIRNETSLCELLHLIILDNYLAYKRSVPEPSVRVVIPRPAPNSLLSFAVQLCRF